MPPKEILTVTDFDVHGFLGGLERVVRDSGRRTFHYAKMEGAKLADDGISGGRYARDLEGKYLSVNGEKIESDIYTGQKASKFKSQTRHGNFSQLDSQSRVNEDYKKHADQRSVVYTKFCDEYGRPVAFGQRVVNGELVVADQHGNVREIDVSFFKEREAEKASRMSRISEFVDMCTIDDECTMRLFGLNRTTYDAIFGGFEWSSAAKYAAWQDDAGYLGAGVMSSRVAGADCRTSSILMKHASTQYDSYDVLKLRAICESLSRSTILSNSKRNLEAIADEDYEVSQDRKKTYTSKVKPVPENHLTGTAPPEIQYDQLSAM